MALPQSLTEAFTQVEKDLRDAVANHTDGPIVDGQAYSPSDRAITQVEWVYQNATTDQWHEFYEALDELYEALELSWSDGMLWRATDLPEE